MIDTQLLERFVAGSDPSAFRDLVVRHGPAVLRVCRSYLHDPHEAEDAMQATFLILMRRAPSIRDPETLNRWLIGVARRVAARTRKRGAVRSEHEKRWAEMHPESREQAEPLTELRRVVGEELNRLPEVSRQPLALCYLEGLTHEQAARQLNWPVGTLKVRLVRARRLLRDRLDRRGVALSVAFLLLLLRRTGSASMATEMVDSTVKAMTLASSGEFAVLEALFPRATCLARNFGRITAITRWGATSLLIVAVFGVVFPCGIALANRVNSAQEKSALVASRLAKVLAVDCR